MAATSAAAQETPLAELFDGCIRAFDAGPAAFAPLGFDGTGFAGEDRAVARVPGGRVTVTLRRDGPAPTCTIEGVVRAASGAPKTVLPWTDAEAEARAWVGRLARALDPSVVDEQPQGVTMVLCGPDDMTMITAAGRDLGDGEALMFMAMHSAPMSPPCAK